MHTYAIGGKKSEIRVSVITVLLVISIIASTLINFGIEALAKAFPTVFNGINSFFENWSFLDFSIGNISAFVIFGLLMLGFDKKIWKTEIVNRFLDVPDFTGIWEGNLLSSYDPYKEVKVRMTITQTWTDISILSAFFDLETGKKSSESGSDSAFVNPESHLGKLLKFTYANTAQVAEWEQSEHRGQNELILKEYDPATKKFMALEGTYFNNRGRTGNKGTITMRRVS
jgi:hypothetical protein